MKTTDKCYNWGCQNFVRKDGTEFKYSPQAFGAIGKCKFQRPAGNFNVCKRFEKRKEKLNTNLSIVRAVLEFEKSMRS